MAKIEKKDVVLFWLKKHACNVEDSTQPPSQEEMARRGTPYAERQRFVEDAAKQAQVRSVELESLRAAIAFIEDNG